MKRILFVLVLTCLSITMMADEPKMYLLIWDNDNSSVAYALDDEPKITFSDTDLIIKTNNVEVNYPLESMNRFTYETSKNTAIRNLQTDEVTFRIDGKSLLFPSLKANSKISLYSLNGTLVFTRIIQEMGEYSFPLSGLIPGVYLVNINGLTYKVVKR